ncbi:mechanosensitive ion channel family protein [Salisaeta longa]|uniref:mechanosensitive ion channel family protein n=1 Tax=Salisaeta longa TaxID=503170 RepID=UPI0003B6AC01|nr:mechanosensitive ion channel family protein [Salisaeta longa]
MDLSTLPLNATLIYRLVVTAAVLGAAYGLIRLGHRLIKRYVHDATHRYQAAKWVRRGTVLLAAVFTIALWSPSASGVFTLLTIIGAGLAVALRDVLLSLVGGVRLSWHVPFAHGDRIEVNGVRGDVVDIGPLQTAVMEVGEWVAADQSTGRIVHIPNSWLFVHAVKNYTDGFDFIWNEVSVVVTFQSDWRAARGIVEEVAEELLPDVTREAREQLQAVTRDYLVRYRVLTPYVYVDMVDHGVRLTLRHLTHTRGRRNLRHGLTIELLERFETHPNIAIAYPTYTVHGANPHSASPDRRPLPPM